MLLDEVRLKVSSGRGGRGGVAFNKLKMARGPTGGNGGRGGSIFFEGVSDLGALAQFRHQKELEAEAGGPGRGNFVDGKSGPDLVYKIPVGTVIHNLTNHQTQEMLQIGQRLLGAQGGQGGKGNFKFRSATNTTPKEFQPGLPGEIFELELELKMFADIGFVGQPNVGKSTLLNLLTNAKSKVANYPFTTLEPNLGTYYDLILADIPGLIEGASTGKGLGHKFLRHIERTKILFHLLAVDSPDIVNDYQTIRAELLAHNPTLADKVEYLFLSKSDLVTPAELKKKLTQAKKLNPQVFAFSLLDDESLQPIKEILNKIAQAKTTPL